MSSLCCLFLFPPQGLLGLGVADAGTAQEAVAAAHMEAYKRLTPIPLYRGHTLYHRIEHNYNMLKVCVWGGVSHPCKSSPSPLRQSPP